MEIVNLELEDHRLALRDGRDELRVQRSTQHLLILLDEEVCDGGDCTDMVHAAAEG